jgi:hypothetical protein
MHKYHWISWEGHNVGSTIGDRLLPSTTDLLHTVAVKYLCSSLQKSQFISPNIETKTYAVQFLMTN